MRLLAGERMTALGIETPVKGAVRREPTCSNMELAKTTRVIRDRVSRNRPLPLYGGYTEGERSELNDPVLSQDHIERFFAYADAGVCVLPPDVPTDSRNRVTRTDRLSG